MYTAPGLCSEPWAPSVNWEYNCWFCEAVEGERKQQTQGAAASTQRSSGNICSRGSPCVVCSHTGGEWGGREGWPWLRWQTGAFRLLQNGL